MTNKYKNKLMQTALRRINCSMLGILGSSVLMALNDDNVDHVICVNIPNSGLCAISINTLCRYFSGIKLNYAEYIERINIHVVHKSDYWQIFDALVAMKRIICISNGLTMLYGTNDEIYKLARESDLIGEDN